MDGLNAILANRSHLLVLRVLDHATEPLSGRAIERLSGLSNRGTMLALNALVTTHAVFRDVRSLSHLYTLNHDHYLVAKALKPAFDAEELIWEDLARTVRRIVKPRPIAAVATGPMAREEADYGGRVMLTMLFSSGRNRIRALGSIRVLADRIRDRYGMIMEHHLLDMNTMDRKEYIPLWRSVEREGILLFGTLP